MKIFCILSVILVTALASDELLYVKWGVKLPLFGTDVLYEIPTTSTSLIDQGWVQVTRPDGPLSALTMYCPADDYTYCLLVDTLGYVSGYQVSLFRQNFTENYIEDLTTVGFVDWTINGNAYWSNQVYLVSDAYLTLTAEEQEAARQANFFMPESKVWVPNVDGTLLEVPTTEDGYANTLFTEQACIPLMGKHYYYNTTTETDCKKMFPWFTLLQDGQLVGMGFVVNGKLSVGENQRYWFESSSKLFSKIIVPNGPDCLYELAGSPGRITQHVYFNYNPNSHITC